MRSTGAASGHCKAVPSRRARAEPAKIAQPPFSRQTTAPTQNGMASAVP